LQKAHFCSGWDEKKIAGVLAFGCKRHLCEDILNWFRTSTVDVPILRSSEATYLWQWPLWSPRLTTEPHYNRAACFVPIIIAVQRVTAADRCYLSARRFCG